MWDRTGIVRSKAWLRSSLHLVIQLQTTRFTRSRITPTKRLLMWMKINSNVKCHNGFSC